MHDIAQGTAGMRGGSPLAELGFTKKVLKSNLSLASEMTYAQLSNPPRSENTFIIPHWPETKLKIPYASPA